MRASTERAQCRRRDDNERCNMPFRLCFLSECYQVQTTCILTFLYPVHELSQRVGNPTPLPLGTAPLFYFLSFFE